MSDSPKLCPQCGIGVAQERFGGFCRAQCYAHKEAGFKPTKPRDFHVERNYRRPGAASDAAAASSRYAKVGDLHRKIWKRLAQKPATCYEVRAWLDVELGRTSENPFKLQSTRARISDLRNPRDKYGQKVAPLVVETGVKRGAKNHMPAHEMRVTTEKQRAAWPQPGWEKVRG